MQERMICACKFVKYSDIKNAIANGCKTVEDVKKATNAATACGKCTFLIQNVIDEEN